MRIAKLRVQGIRGLAERTFDFLPPGAREPLGLAVITGPPGTGKTSLLESIVAAKEDIAPVGPPLPAHAVLRPGAKTGRIECTWFFTEREQAQLGLESPLHTSVSVFGEGHGTSERPKWLRELLRLPVHGCGQLAYFQATRILPSGAAAGGPRLDPRSPDLLGSSTSRFAPLRAYVVDQVLRDGLDTLDTLRSRGVVLGPDRAKGHARLVELLRPFLHKKVFDGVDETGEGRRRVRFLESGGDVLDLDDLSASEKQGAIFALMFEMCGLSHSVVLIDTPELHIAPSHQTTFLQALQALGENNQIIAATSAPSLLASVSPSQITDLSRLA